MPFSSTLPRLPSEREIAAASARPDAPDGLEGTVRLLRALAHPSRTMIYRELAKAGPVGRTQAELMTALGLRFSTIAGHLGTLINAGLVKGVHEADGVRYLAGREALQLLADFLAPQPWKP
jgi:DNA-binding transcriptional ArsR family regulator